MSDLNKKAFYTEVITHLEEVLALYEEYDFDEDDYGEEGSEQAAKQDALVRFINHIRDATEIAESGS